MFVIYPGFARVFAIICGSLQQWFKQTKGVEEALLEYQLTLTEILDELVQWNKNHDSLLLINSPLDDSVSMSVLTVNLSVIGILEMAVHHCPDKMTNKHWDLVLRSLAGWLQVMLLTQWNCTVTFLWKIPANLFKRHRLERSNIKAKISGSSQWVGR